MKEIKKLFLLFGQILSVVPRKMFKFFSDFQSPEEKGRFFSSEIFKRNSIFEQEFLEGIAHIKISKIVKITKKYRAKNRNMERILKNTNIWAKI